MTDYRRLLHPRPPVPERHIPAFRIFVLTVTLALLLSALWVFLYGVSL